MSMLVVNVALDHCSPKNDNDAEDFDLSVLVVTLDKWVIMVSVVAFYRFLSQGCP